MEFKDQADVQVEQQAVEALRQAHGTTVATQQEAPDNDDLRKMAAELAQLKKGTESARITGEELRLHWQRCCERASFGLAWLMKDGKDIKTVCQAWTNRHK